MGFLRKTKKGFGTFGVQDTLEFATAQNLHLTNSIEELRSIISEFRPTARLNLEAEDVINLIHAAGGLAILAHPNTNLRRTSKPKELLNYLIGKGIDGFEMYYPGNTNQSDNMVREMINKSGKKFLFTGGSDYHSDELYELEYKNLITYTPPTISKVKEFIDNMYELKIAREKGDLLVKDYKALKKFNAKKVVKHYSEMSAFIDVESEDFLR